jgi:flagellar biosynthesis protein FlhB
MAEQDKESRTEQPTGRRLEKARQEGDVPKSRELTSLFPLWTIFLFFVFGSAFFASLVNYFRGSLVRGVTTPLNETSLIYIFREDTAQIGLMMMPLLALILFGVMVIHFLQTGFLITTKPLELDLSKLSPLSGLKRLVSLNMVFETVKGLLKVAALGLILYFLLKKEVFNLPLLVDMGMPTIVDYAFVQIKKLIMISALVLTIFAAADFAYQKWNYTRQKKMTKDEIKEEYKEIEGSPMVKQRIRSVQREMARRRMMQEVPKADVIITNPTHFAVALKYDVERMGAPRVVAKGANLVAKKIREIAKANHVPVIENKPLARALFGLKLEQEIPEIFYKAVAAILAQVYKEKGKVLG